VEEEDLKTEITHILEEARMIIPGIQALFGFQLVAVFNQRFAERLGWGDQRLHYFALLLVAVAAGFSISPAAYHRQAERGRATRYFADFASRQLSRALAVLMLAIGIDGYLIGKMILGRTLPAMAIGVMLFGMLAWQWFVFPRSEKYDARRRHEQPS
jgi:hypothetical protein